MLFEHRPGGRPDPASPSDRPGVLHHVHRLGHQLGGALPVHEHRPPENRGEEQDHRPQAPGVIPAEVDHDDQSQNGQPHEEGEDPRPAGAVPESPDVHRHQQEVEGGHSRMPPFSVRRRRVGDVEVDRAHDADRHPQPEHVLLGGVADVVVGRRQDQGAEAGQPSEDRDVPQESQVVEVPDLELGEQDVERRIDVGQPEERPYRPVGEGGHREDVEGPDRRKADQLVHERREGGDADPYGLRDAVEQEHSPERAEEVDLEADPVPPVQDQPRPRDEERDGDGHARDRPLHDVQGVVKGHAGVDQVRERQSGEPQGDQQRRGHEGHGRVQRSAGSSSGDRIGTGCHQTEHNLSTVLVKDSKNKKQKTSARRSFFHVKDKRTKAP